MSVGGQGCETLSAGEGGVLVKFDNMGYNMVLN